MKKLYSLLAAAGITASAFAFPVQKAEYAGALTLPDFSTQVVKQADYQTISNNKGMYKILNKDTNEEWSLLIAITGEWGLKNNDGTDATIEEFPFLQMLIATQPLTEGNNDLFSMYVNWPCYGATDMDLTIRNDKGQIIRWDREKVEAKYGEKAFKPMTYEDFLEANEGGLLVTMPGLYLMPCIVGPEAFGNGPYSWRVNGGEVYAKSAIITDDNRINYSDATTFDWSSFDPTTADVTANFQGKYCNTVGGALAGTVTADLEGAGVILGFMDIDWNEIGEVHILNGGRQAAGDDWTWNYVEQSPVPLNFYYLCFCDQTMGYMAKSQEGEEMQNFTNTTLPTGGSQSDPLLGAPSYAFYPDSHYTFLAGAIWASENAELPYGVWTMKEPRMNGNVVEQMPEAYNLTVAGVDDTAADFGFYGCYEGYRQYGLPGQVAVGIGDKTHGLNFTFGSGMTNGFRIRGSFTDDIILHNVPDQWLTMTALPAVGNIDADVITNPSAVETVESDAPVVSKSFYNFQGQRLGSEPESGMYIIRAVKADGTVKATKVAK